MKWICAVVAFKKGYNASRNISVKKKQKRFRKALVFVLLASLFGALQLRQEIKFFESMRKFEITDLTNQAPQSHDG